MCSSLLDWGLDSCYEAGVIQRLSLYLGHPTLSLSVVLLGLLLGGGLGSGLTQRFWREVKRHHLGIFAALFVFILALIFSFGVPPLLNATLHFPLWGRIAISWALVLPLGFFLGMPFPLGLRLTKSEFIPLAWGINGLGTVAGAVGAMALATIAGFHTVLLAGGCIYLLVVVLIRSTFR